MGMAPLAFAAKPAFWIACAGVAATAIAIVAWRSTRASGEVEELLPRVDVAAYNDALMAP